MGSDQLVPNAHSGESFHLRRLVQLLFSSEPGWPVLVKNPGGFFPEQLPFKLYSMGSIDGSIHDGIGDSGVANQAVPRGNRQLGKNDSRLAIMAVRAVRAADGHCVGISYGEVRGAGSNTRIMVRRNGNRLY